MQTKQMILQIQLHMQNPYCIEQEAGDIGLHVNANKVSVLNKEPSPL